MRHSRCGAVLDVDMLLLRPYEPVVAGLCPDASLAVPFDRWSGASGIVNRLRTAGTSRSIIASSLP